MSRVYNFSAGPAVMPESVLQRIRGDIPDWNGSGMSIMEVSHRSKEFVAVAEQAEQDLRELLDVPKNYSVLFPQGGASMQFSMVPLNLSAAGEKVDYVQTGSWSKKAIAEARRYCDVHVVADSAEDNFTNIPPQETWHCSSDAAYLHYTPNETIGGVEFHFVPDASDAVLVADMSSTILSRPVDVRKFGVIYAGAQKNIGPAGITLVIVRNDLLPKVREETPALLRYSAYAESGSMINTPPVFRVVCGRPGVSGPEETRWTCTSGSRKRTKSGQALCGNRYFGLLFKPRRQKLPLLDECAFCFGRCRTRQSISYRVFGCRADKSERAQISRWYACINL